MVWKWMVRKECWGMSWCKTARELCIYRRWVIRHMTILYDGFCLNVCVHARMGMDECCVDGMYCRYGVYRLDAQIHVQHARVHGRIHDAWPVCSNWNYRWLCGYLFPFVPSRHRVATRLTTLQCRVAGQQLWRRKSSTANLLRKQTWRPRLQSSWPRPNSNTQQMFPSQLRLMDLERLWSSQINDQIAAYVWIVFFEALELLKVGHTALSQFLSDCWKMLKKNIRKQVEMSFIVPFSPLVFSSKQQKAEASGERTNLQRAFQFWDIDSAYVPSHC